MINDPLKKAIDDYKNDGLTIRVNWKSYGGMDQKYAGWCNFWLKTKPAYVAGTPQTITVFSTGQVTFAANDLYCEWNNFNTKHRLTCTLQPLGNFVFEISLFKLTRC